VIVIGLVVIDAEFGRKNYSSIFIIVIGGGGKETA
jgi:hypothetical protein